MSTFRQDAILGKKVPQMKTDDYNDKSVTTIKIADEAVTKEKIAPKSVTEEKIADSVLESLKEDTKVSKATVTVGENIGTPTAEVSVSRDLENKPVLNFSFDGLKGEQGIKGDKGDKGEIGEVGKVSVKVDNTSGTPSATATSSKGEDGKSNIVINFSGLKGEKGEKGDKGDRGLQGIQGIQGLQGEQGIQGIKGDQGERGERGLQGLQGERGLRGEQGLRGIQGEKGDVGEIGKINITIGNTVGQPSAKATTTKQKDGTTDIDISFENLKGEQGEQGIKGDQGLQGIQGIQGERGEQGEAAGFGEITASVDDEAGTPSVTVSTSGTNKAKNITFSFSGLKGEKGDQGTKGDKGEKGDQGLQGIQGIQGERGEQGEVGATGAQGIQGERGLQGLQGERGEKGEKGDKGDKMTLADLSQEDIAELQKPALDAANRANTAAEGAEKCNVTLDGSVISVTDREGETKTIDVIGPGEKVVVYVSSFVEGLSVAGLKINVYLNNGKTPQTYTTDSEGVAKFEVDRGNYYEVVFPEFGNAQAIAPVGFTSVLGARDIRVEYKPYSMDETEEATISVMKYEDGNGTAFVGAKVSVTVGDETQEYTTDDSGKVFVYVPYGKDYTVSVKDQDAYYVRYAKNNRTYTAKLPKRSIVYTMYQYKTGILVVDDSLNEYLIDDWLADGKSPDDAVAIRVAEQQLLLNGGSFLFRVSDLKNLSKLPSRQWCTQNIQFNSIALNGNSVKDENYYRGETSTFLIRQEAEERSLSIPALDYAWNQELVIGNQHLRGFLMSVGQEYIHIANRVEIGEVLRKLFGDEIADAYLTFVTSKNRWTSTQNGATLAWDCNSQAGSINKNGSSYVLPVFAC